jgi:hypothetical protein
MALFDHQRLAMLLEKEADARGGHSGPQSQSIGNQGVEIEELNHLQRSPYLFPTAGLVRRIEHIDHRAFKCGDANLATRMADRRDPSPLFGNPEKR